VIVVGAGLAGLACAQALTRAGRAVHVLEASDGPGGRVRSDLVDGFRLDRGFQVFFTAYPEARRVLDYRRLQLRSFVPGAIVRHGGRFYRLLDPFRAPIGALSGLAAPIGSLGDKLRVLKLRRRAMAMSLEGMFGLPDRTTRRELEALGFSSAFIERFFTPLLGGVFLDTTLSTSSRMLYFVYKMLAEGDVTLPSGGMQAIPDSIVAELPAGSVRYGTRVCALCRTNDTVTGVALQTGEHLPAAAVVVATEMVGAHALTATQPLVQPRPVACLYFAAPADPVGAPLLVLDGENRGPVSNLCVPSRVSASYAPAGQSLVSATVVGEPAGGDEALERAVREQMTGWFGAAAVARWRHLRTYRIPWAQFDQSPAALPPSERPVRHGAGLFVCGDHLENASINGALRSGRRAAEAVLADLGAR
jgi:phytoene dehydrogenase-like protein